MKRSQSGARRLELGFLLLLAVFCLALLFIQYRWTGEISRAESARLHASLGEALQRMGKAFDAELEQSCRELLPLAEELDLEGHQTVHAARLEAWKAAHPRPCFARIAVAVPAGDGIKLMAVDQASGRLAEQAWPAEWGWFRERVERLRTGRNPQRMSIPNPASNLIEFPVFANSPHEGRRRRELEWLLLELDLEYVRRVWLPELVQTYLNPGPEALFALEVRWTAESNTVIYASQPATGTPGWGPEGEASCFAVEAVRSRGHDVPRDPILEKGRWLLQGRCLGGQLEDVVARARWRNLTLAALVNGLIWLAGAMLVRQTRLSRRAAESQMHFVAGVSHELRTPLTVIQSAAHNLLKGVVQDPDRIRDYARLIATQAEQLKQMIEQVLTFSSVRQSARPLAQEELVLREVVERALRTLATEVQAADCQVESRWPEGLPKVRGDAAALQRVFLNLLGNALKHGAAGRWIGLTAHELRQGSETWVEVEVADRGPGIPAAERVRVFEPFFRGEHARKHQVHGTGLGLSVASEIVKAHGGTLYLRNEAGPGAAFRVRLPAVPGGPPA